MTAIYQLMELPEDFRTISLNVMSLASMLNGVNFNELRKQPTSNISLQPYWSDNVSCSSKEVLGENTSIPDIFVWLRTYLVLSSEAAKILSPYLESKGELLPIRVDDEPMYIFNCLQFGKEDLELCAKRYLNGIEDGYDTLAFDQDDVSEKLVFKSRLVGPTLFVTDEFKSLCESHKFKGLRFEPNLLAVF
ncbi:conserved hypothetical protein [Vibrio nigripulchritudo SFn27]|uniref:Uncharacterized protein n=1 Tax=Vibrio nigripulchritudo TaxID=28173 RepID=U4KFD3_9VIBR|nr:hypothetical protein [Vibrio nigripulchritudo]CCN84528.1 conserved hypothetical protein [Vibrio nigripulchritudo BLFn1]CCN88850.1 conserved hypothetical protein [Vibrio nigripulchritudo SFn27]CCN94338.1 conserved hypothetical protein [Vibrio nigripulchritudo ENn2]CCO40185.1 conserved hypothetical protein [Vibrio nigripulchritudo SFn135]CCO51522.1 conserved hypothetical protein [Vibrio nigripulchritudo Wn13]